MDKELTILVNEAVEQVFKEASFRIYNDTLNPELWDQNKQLDPQIRATLLQLAHDFYEKTKFVAPILDIWLMGSISNYNWTPESDVDVHIIIDFSQLQMPPETASKVAKAAGAQWNKEHNVTIKGYKVELNIQNVKAEKPYIMGIYSLTKGQWIREPQKLDLHLNIPVIQAKYSELKKYIKDSVATGDRNLMKQVKDYLDAFRQYGLDTAGELSIENIVYKILRSRGLIVFLKNAIIATYDKQMTIAEDDALTKKDYIGGVMQGEVRAEPVPAGKVKFYMHNDFPGLCSGQNNTNWRYKSDKNQVLWNLEPAPEDKVKVTDYLSKRGILNPTHKPMYTFGEVAQKDIKARHPQDPNQWGPKPDRDPLLDQMSLDNLKALRDKALRFSRAGAWEYRMESLKKAKFFNNEIKRRLALINAPVMEDIANKSYNAAVDFHERREAQMCELANFLSMHKKTNVPWKTVPASLLKKVWLQFGKYRRVDINGIDKIADQILTNIARLDIANGFQGHDQYSPREEISDSCGIEFTDEEWNENVWRFYDPTIGDFVSDYGIEPLRNIYPLIFNADTPEEKLYACDKALNVVHQRNDLAAMFVEGGVRTLNDVAEQGGYDANYEHGEINKQFRDKERVYEAMGTPAVRLPDGELQKALPNERMHAQIMARLVKQNHPNVISISDPDVEHGWVDDAGVFINRDEMTKKLKYKADTYAKSFNEGVGWVHTKDIDKDPLHIPGERWRIKWDTKRKTPKIPD